MASPRQLIAALDRSLRRNGTSVVLRRRIGASNDFVSVNCRVAARSDQVEPLAGNAAQQLADIVMSPSEINAASATWPGAAAGGTWPKKGDLIVSGTRSRTVELSDPIEVQDTVVRINLTVKG